MFKEHRGNIIKNEPKYFQKTTSYLTELSNLP